MKIIFTVIKIFCFSLSLQILMINKILPNESKNRPDKDFCCLLGQKYEIKKFNVLTNHLLSDTESKTAIIRNWNCLHLCVLLGFTHYIPHLIKEGYDINQIDSTGATPLHLAAFRQNNECVNILIKHGANLNQQDKRGETPLHYAYFSASYIQDNKTITTLKNSGASENYKNCSGQIPLDLALHRR